MCSCSNRQRRYSHLKIYEDWCVAEGASSPDDEMQETGLIMPKDMKQSLPEHYLRLHQQVQLTADDIGIFSTGLDGI